MTADEKCPNCKGDASDNWFDRSICPCAGDNYNGIMHTRCCNCGHALDGCGFEDPNLSKAAAQ